MTSVHWPLLLVTTRAVNGPEKVECLKPEDMTSKENEKQNRKFHDPPRFKPHLFHFVNLVLLQHDFTAYTKQVLYLKVLLPNMSVNFYNLAFYNDWLSKTLLIFCQGTNDYFSNIPTDQLPAVFNLYHLCTAP
jgi:hypothetical protein